MLNANPDSFSKIGVHTSSVTPGYTVDSYITIEPLLIYLPTSLLELIIGSRSGVLSSLIGVGTVTMKIFLSDRSSAFEDNLQLT